MKIITFYQFDIIPNFPGFAQRKAQIWGFCTEMFRDAWLKLYVRLYFLLSSPLPNFIFDFTR